MANSAIIKGKLLKTKKIAHGIRKVPPSFWDTMRGNLQIFPVPTAIPKTETINPKRDEKTSDDVFLFMEIVQNISIFRPPVIKG